MGEVYLAKDVRLDRKLAVKVMPESFAGNPEALKRFEREARAASALKHPGIVTIYDIGHLDSQPFIAMELVEGCSLRDILFEGPVPLQRAVKLAAQLADALAAAHQHGIVHRDLKPENIMVTDQDRVKILDFGLAKRETSLEGRDQEETRTHTTQKGTILGTACYMSPQQAEGLDVDYRSDQFSLGIILYEMTTGMHPFKCKTSVETIVAIMREKPRPVSRLNPQVPQPLEWIVERCLSRLPEERYLSTHDLARDLDVVLGHIQQGLEAPESPSPVNVPVPLTSLIGRARETESVMELLVRDAVRLVTLTGPGGVGKTRLAIEIGTSVSQHFPGGIWFVTLASITDANLIPETIGKTMGIRGEASRTAQSPLKEYLLNECRAATLLILDNFEQLLSGAPFLAELLATCPMLKLLVTSRAGLRIYGEHEFPLDSLGVPDLSGSPSTDSIRKAPAVMLFMERALAVRPDIVFDDDNSHRIAEICRRLDGLPLAIELAAARIRMLPLPAMLARIEDRLRLLTGGPRDSPLRQQTLRGAIRWSYDLLNSSEQKLFRRLSVFIRGFMIDAAEAVCDTKRDLGIDIFEGLESLVANSLLRQAEGDGGEVRFSMLETIREFAMEQLKESGEEAITRRAHAAYYLVLTEEANSNVPSECSTTFWMDRFDLEHENLRSALEHLTQTDNAEWGLRLGSALLNYWDTRAHLAEGRDRLLALLKLPSAQPRTRVRAQALFAAGLLGNSDFELALRLHRESLEIYTELGDPLGMLSATNALAGDHQFHGRYEDARHFWQDAVQIAQSLRDPASLARALNNLAGVVQLEGGTEEARSLYEQSLEIFRSINDRRALAAALNNLGELACHRNDQPAARSLYEQSLAEFRSLRDRWGMARTLQLLGDLARDQGDYGTALSNYKESLQQFHELKHARGVARLLESCAGLMAAVGDREQAIRLKGAAASLRNRKGIHEHPSSERTKLERSLESAQQQLERTQATAAWMEGWAMSMEAAVESVLTRSC